MQGDIVLPFSQIMYLARRWARLRRITVLGPWVGGRGLPPKLSALQGAPQAPPHSFCPLAVFDCRTFQLNKGKHQCFAEGLKIHGSG